MKDLKGIKGKYYIERLISEGEHEHQDFKFAISDARKIARSISAFANNDGGRLLVGVKDNGAVAGVRNEEDIYVIEQAAEMYCFPPQKFDVTAFKADEGKTVVRVTIDRCAERPVEVLEADGSRKAYYRVKDENIIAPPLMVRAWRAAATSDSLTALADGESRLLAMMDEALALEDYMLAAKVSRASAESTVIRLFAMGLLDFHYNGHSFMLVRKE